MTDRQPNLRSHAYDGKRVIGYWVQSLDGPLSHCVPQTLALDPYPAEERKAVASFLRRGERWRQMRGYAWCRFSCDAPDQELGGGHWSQANWAWPDSLAHYVEAHGVRVPLELERAALGLAPLEVPSSGGLGWWVDWCADHLPHGFEERLRAARSETKAKVEQAVREAEALVHGKASDLEREMGVDEAPCVKAGCEGRRLQGRAHCAWHVLTINGSIDLERARRRAESSGLHAFLVGGGGAKR